MTGPNTGYAPNRTWHLTLRRPRKKWSKTAPEAAEILGVPFNTFRNWIVNKKVAKSETCNRGYDLHKIHDWLTSQLETEIEEAKTKRPSKREVANSDAAQRLKTAQARLMELKLAREAGQLVEKRSVTEALNQIGGILTARFSTFGVRVAPSLEGMTTGERARALDREIREVMEDFSSECAQIEVLLAADLSDGEDEDEGADDDASD